MAKGAWIRIKYISERTGREVGNTAHVQDKEMMRELLDRYYLTPDRITYLEIDGQQYNATPENIKALIK